MKKPNILNNYTFRLYMLTLLGFIMMLILFWGQYLRPRLPRDIPFHLTLFRLFLLLFTCLVFILVLKQLIRPKPSKVFIYIYPYLYPYHQIIFQPLAALDLAIRDSLFIKSIIKWFAQHLSYITFMYSYQTLLLHFFLTFIPRILLLILFILDIFYFKKLELMYIYIWLGFIPLFIRYVKYILEQTLEDYILYLDPLYEGYVIPQNKEQQEEWNDLHQCDWEERKYSYYAKPIREFIFYKTTTYEEYKYAPVPTWAVIQKYYTSNEIHEKCLGDRNQMPKDMKEVVERDFYALIPLALNLEIFMTRYNYIIKEGNSVTDYDITFNIKRRYPLKDWNIGIYSIYLSCWIYILVISISTFTLSGNELIILTNFLDNLEPFTNVMLDHENKPN